MRTTDEAADVATGVFSGLKYQTPTTSGVTNERGEFRYRAGEAVTFLVGGLVLGAVEGAPRVNLAQLVNRVAGKIDRLHDPLVTNLARLIQTLDQDGTVEKRCLDRPDRARADRTRDHPFRPGRHLRR